MKETWRWYGPLDQISLSEVRQTGAAGIVTALHEIPYGEVWQRTTIAKRRDKIRVAGFEWDVVESLPLHEDIKRGTGDLTSLFANYRQSMANLAAEGVHTICYNFMPLLDWTRTELNSPAANGGTCLRFSAFSDGRIRDLHVGSLGSRKRLPHRCHRKGVRMVPCFK